MPLIKNAAPTFISLGTDDQSTVALLPSRDPLPQHLPKFFIRSPKGTTTPVVVSTPKLKALLGDETFNQNGVYYNHQTRFLEAVASTGNSVMVQRVVSQDAGARSNIVIYIDVLPTQVPNYVRNSLGELVIDPATNNYKVDPVTPTIAGHELKFITEYATVDTGLSTYASKAGTMTDATTGTVSTMYPFMALAARYQGSAYNDIGIAIESLLGADVSSAIIDSLKAMPYKLALYTRVNAGATPTVMRSLFGEPSVETVLTANSINPATNSRFDIDAVFGSQWYNETDSLKTLRYNDFEGMYIYRANLELIHNLIMTLEQPYISDTSATWDDGLTATTRSWTDFTTADPVAILNEGYLLNLFTCKTSKNIPYFTVGINTSVATLVGNQKEVNITANTPIFLQGGSDGTLDNASYETVVSAIMDEYLNPDSQVQDNAINVETVIYDSGFTLNTKFKLANFIGLRKDTNVILSTHDAALGEVDLPLSDARAVAVAIKSALALMPESQYFGTGVMRAVIVGGTGLLRSGATLNRIPLTYEIAFKSAKFMGAGNYKWKTVEAFDHGANAVLSELVDITPAFIPAGIKPTLWNDGMVWAQPKDRVNYFFPAVQTAYSNDTSILNAWPNAFACSVLDRIGSDAWREFTGTTFLTDSEFIDAVEAYVNTRIAGIFGGLLTVIPQVVIDSGDAARGYSFHLNNKLYGNNMRTVMVYNTTAYRASALP